jgi:hypothetical protein
MFGSEAAVPKLEWKASPTKGHAMGWLSVEGGPRWLADGAGVHATSDTGKDFARSSATDANGFFGFVDLPPDRYRLRLERGGVILFEHVPLDVRPGEIARFEIRLKAEDFRAALPLPQRLDSPAVPPGGIAAISGLRLAPLQATAPVVPLPVRLAAAQVLVNGKAAPIFQSGPEEIVVQFPYVQAEQWEVRVRHSGMESTPISAAWVPARPVITGVNRVGRYLEIYATGLGMLDSAIAAGSGADPTLPLPQVASPVRVRIGVRDLPPEYAGLMPYQPGRYQVNLLLPEDSVTGTLRLVVAGIESNLFEF